MTRKSIDLFGGDRDRGVSPVIGVILMVAITVILAAVIGTFVLGLGQQVSKTTPVSTIAVSDAATNYSDGDSAPAFTLAHNGGDAIEASNVKIVIRNATDSSTVATWTVGSSSGLNVELNGQGFNSSDTFSVGDTLTVINKSVTDLNSGETYVVQLIHTPSQGQVVSSEVTLQ